MMPVPQEELPAAPRETPLELAGASAIEHRQEHQPLEKTPAEDFEDGEIVERMKALRGLKVRANREGPSAATADTDWSSGGKRKLLLIALLAVLLLSGLAVAAYFYLIRMRIV
jgi:hypothetical protein